MSGIKLYPSRVTSKTSAMNRQLDRLKEGVTEEKRVMQAVSACQPWLQGVAWDSARSYVREIQMPLLDTTLLWVECQKDSNNRYSQAAAALPAVNCLDQDLLEEQLDRWERRLER